MWKFIGQRLLQMFLLFILFLTILFFLLEAQPGDLTQQFIGNPEIPPEAKAIIAARLGLDKPPLERYLQWMFNFFKGDMGVSMSQFPRDVRDLLLEALPRTLVLFLSATVLAYYVGFVTGKFLAWRRGRRSEYAVTLVGVGLYTVFYPWFAILMIWTFGFALGWFPINKFIDVSKWTGAPYTPNQVFQWMILATLVAGGISAAVAAFSSQIDNPRTASVVRKIGFFGSIALVVGFFWASPVRPYAADILHHTILPVMTLTAVAFAGIMLLTRSSMLETLREDYILTARAKGLPDHVVRDRHAARNALLPVVTSLVIALAFVIGGGIITETLFSWPGIGLLLYSAVRLEDIPLAMGGLAVIGILALLGHLIADILYMYLDPRIRYQ
jgi:peptide/nickel transport system permease protein